MYDFLANRLGSLLRLVDPTKKEEVLGKLENMVAALGDSIPVLALLVDLYEEAASPRIKDALEVVCSHTYNETTHSLMICNIDLPQAQGCRCCEKQVLVRQSFAAIDLVFSCLLQ